MHDYRKIKFDLKKNGFVIIRNHFSESEINKVREKCFNYCKIDNFTENADGDILSLNGVSDFILSEKYMGIIKKILDDDVVYFGDSSLDCSPNSRMFHKDARNDKKDPSKSDYNIYRVAVFMQDHFKNSGGIKFRKGSHKKIKFSLGNVLKILLGKRSIRSIFNFGRIINARSRIGDIVIWNLRTDHSGGAVLNKIIPNLGFLPIIDGITPSFLKYPEPKHRMALFCCFGKDTESLRDYLNYKVNDKRYKRHWKLSKFNNPEILNKAEELNIKIIHSHLIN